MHAENYSVGTMVWRDRRKGTRTFAVVSYLTDLRGHSKEVDRFHANDATPNEATRVALETARKLSRKFKAEVWRVELDESGSGSFREVDSGYNHEVEHYARRTKKS